MISTPYFDELQIISRRTSTHRDQNNKLAAYLHNRGFSSVEINQITETENFVRFRPSKKKICTGCGVAKNYQCFYKFKNTFGIVAKCRICDRQDRQNNYANFEHVRKRKSIQNKENRMTSKEKIKKGIYD